MSLLAGRFTALERPTETRPYARSANVCQGRDFHSADEYQHATAADLRHNAPAQEANFIAIGSSSQSGWQYDRRRTETTGMIASGSSHTEVMKITGHSQISTFLRYLNVTNEAVNRTASRLSEYLARREAVAP